jgi:hypothetical protein
VKSALECFLEAERLDGLVRATSDAVNRRHLAEAAKSWRLLAEAAKADEARGPVPKRERLST